MATKGQSKKGLIIGVVGLVLIILGVLWMTVLFPALNKMPATLDHTLYFDGNLTVPDPTTHALVTLPIEEVLVQKDAGTQDDALFVHENYQVNNAITGENLPAYTVDQTLAVDRKTLAIVTDIDEQHRSGYWGPPRGLGESDTFDLWNPGAHRALTAIYVKADTFRDMKVVIFKIDAKDISLGNDSQTQLPLLMDTTINLTIEPKTGVVVDEEALTTTSVDMGGEKAPVVITYVRYAERTIVDLMDKAKSASKMLMLMQTVVPGVLIGVGAVLVIINIAFTRRKKQT